MASIELRENEFLQKFVGPDHVDSNDVQFWYQLLSCSFNFMRVQDPKTVDKALNPFINLLALNNSESLNFGSLIRVAIDRVSRVKSANVQAANPYYVYQSFNALYLIRSICKNYIENTSEDKLVQSFRAKIEDQPQSPKKSPTPPLPPPAHLQKAIPDNQAINQSNQAQDSNGPVVDGAFHVTPATTTNQPAIQSDNGIQNQLPFPNASPTMANNTSLPPPNSQDANNQVDSKKASVEVTSGLVMLDQFMSTLIEIIVDIPLSDSTYLLQVEAINSLLVLLSIQMYSNTRANHSTIFKSLMHKRCSIHALVLTKTLLNNFIRQEPMPQETGSIIIGLASGLWRVLTLGYAAQEEEIADTMPLLARQSLLLINVLTNHYTSEKNPYREAVISCQDSRFNPSDPRMTFDNASNDLLASAATSQSVLTANNIKVEFNELFNTICAHLSNDQVALLLYLLLNSNKIFKPYILTAAANRLDQLVLPLLKILYSSIQKGSHHVYMVLIIFVILSEEASFNEALHRIIVKGIPWFKERILSEITLGSFTTLVIVRTFQYNTFRIRDKFLHTNLFATLGNLSNYFHMLHPYVCQRMLDFLEKLTKRYVTTSKPNTVHQQTTRLKSDSIMQVFDSDNQLAKALATDRSVSQEVQDASSIELDSTFATGSTSVPVQMNGSSAIDMNFQQQHQQQLNIFTNDILPPVTGQSQEYSPGQESGQQPTSSNNSTSDHIQISMDMNKQDIGMIEEVIRMILEVINNSLAAQLSNNPDLVYTMLYKRSVFSSLLSSHQSFYNMVINIERILTFFYNKIEALDRQLSVEEIKELIQTSSSEWCFDQNRDPDSQLLFRYVEDEQPEDFFIPYMWTKIYYSSGIAWDPKRIALFNPEVV